jgi:hypothetical protein
MLVWLRVSALTSSCFGLKNSRSRETVVVLDKSFLDGNSSAQLQFVVQNGWRFALPEALWHELFRKRDKRRIADLFKLQSIEKALVILPSIGEMFRAEVANLKPAPDVLRGKFVKLRAIRGPSGEFFELTGDALRSTEERNASIEWKVQEMSDLWRSFIRIPGLEKKSQEDIRTRVRELSEEVRNDRDAMRAFYSNHRHKSWPSPELLVEGWTLFRWIQVHLLAGLDFFLKYGRTNDPSKEKIIHELLDLDYLIPALLVGGLACRETRFIERFKFLRPDGVLLR